MENEWSAHDEYLAQRQIAVDAFQADLEGNNISLNHSFSETDAFFKIEKGIFDGKVGIGITVFDDEKAMIEAAHSHPDYVLSGNDIGLAKDMVEKLIKRFDNKPDVYISDIENSLQHDITMQNLMFEKQSEQAQNTPLERGNINNKEKSMPDEKERIDWENLDSKQKDFLNASIQRKAIADALKTGTLCCLPGADGYADTMPAKNMMSDHLYHGASLLLIKQHQKENGFPTGNYLTSEKIDEAKKEMPGLFLRKDQRSISLYSGMKNEATGEYETTRHKLFNIAQTTKPSELAAWVDQKQQEAHNSREEKKSVDFGASYAKQEYVSKNQPPRTDGPEIVCSSAKPEEYLGQYLAAVSLGGKFKASPEQAAEFSKNFEAGLYKKVTNEQGELMLSKKTGQPFTDPFSLQKIAEKANQHCVNLIRDMKIDAQKQNQPEQKLEQHQSRGRGM